MLPRHLRSIDANDRAVVDIDAQLQRVRNAADDREVLAQIDGGVIVAHVAERRADSDRAVADRRSARLPGDRVRCRIEAGKPPIGGRVLGDPFAVAPDRVGRDQAGCSRRLGGESRRSPVACQVVVERGIDQLERAAEVAGGRPGKAKLVGDGVDERVGSVAQLDRFAVVGKFVADFPLAEGSEAKLGVEVGQILSNDEIATRGECRSIGERIVDSLVDPPARQIDIRAARVVEFDELDSFSAIVGIVVKFVDHDAGEHLAWLEAFESHRPAARLRRHARASRS